MYSTVHTLLIMLVSYTEIMCLSTFQSLYLYIYYVIPYGDIACKLFATWLHMVMALCAISNNF